MPAHSAPSPVDSATHDSLDRRDQQLRTLRFLETLEETLAGCRNELDIYSSAVHRLATMFEADTVALAVCEPVSGAIEIVHQAGSRLTWDLDVFRRAVIEERTVAAGGILAAPILLAEGPPGTRAVTRAWGVLAVARSAIAGAFFSSTERQTLRSAAAHVATEMERRRAFLLDDVLDSLLRKTKPIDVYNHALRELRRFVRYDHSASIMTMQRGMAQITVRAEKVVSSRGQKETLTDSPRRGRPLRLTPAQTRYLTALTDPAILTHDATGWHLDVEHPDPDAAGLWRVLCLNGGDSGEGSVLCYPLVFGGQMLGILRLAAVSPDAFAVIDRYIRVLERFARLLSVTLYRSELYHQSDWQLQAIKQIGRAITEPIPVEEICRQVLELALRVLRVQVGSVGLLDRDDTLSLVAYQGCTLATPPILRAGEGIAGRVIRTGLSRAVANVAHEPAYVVFNERVCSELVAPITYNREVIGFLDVESFEEGRFRDEDKEVITFLEALANQAAIAIKTAQLRNETMERLGMSMSIDPTLSMAGLQDLLVEELRNKIDQLASANDRLATANQTKSEFLAHMSHDLRGPLNVIVGLSNLLTDPDVSATLSLEKQRESLEIIRSSGEFLGSLIGSVLDLSALEAGKVELSIRTFPADPAFNYLRSMAETLAAESRKTLDITVWVDPLVSRIRADEEKFMRILHNLVSNAVKFTQDGGRLTVTAGVAGTSDQSHSEPSDLYVTVVDTGIGIPPEFHQRVFQAFQQIGVPGSGRGHGTGLGLAVVHQLVQLHGGRVWLESTPGVGSSFHVLLPGALPPPASAEYAGAESLWGKIEEAPAALVPLRERVTLHVLVVEDTPAHMDLMRLAVTSRGYAMHGVGSAEDALHWLESHRPDVILLDMQLPGLDGFSLAARIKGQVETHTIPIIAVTADALSLSEERALASGCDAYLTKPIDIAALLATIKAVCT